VLPEYARHRAEFLAADVASAATTVNPVGQARSLLSLRCGTGSRSLPIRLEAPGQFTALSVGTAKPAEPSVRRDVCCPATVRRPRPLGPPRAGPLWSSHPDRPDHPVPELVCYPGSGPDQERVRAGQPLARSHRARRHDTAASRYRAWANWCAARRYRSRRVASEAACSWLARMVRGQ
jgi:hypothetical protein